MILSCPLAIGPMLAALALSPPGPPCTDDDPVHPRSYWKAVADAGYAVPEGEDPFELLSDLFRNLDSPDSVLRDDYGYGITDHWVRRQRLLPGEDCLVLIEQLLEKLEEGLGEPEGDAVLGRSFSALNLSIFAMHDLDRPYLEAADFDLLLDAALEYLAAEKDVRGRHPEQGWLHSAAHTADWIKFLARNPRLAPERQTEIFAAVGRKLVEAGVVFVHGEDERLAETLISLIAREDYDPDRFGALMEVLREGRARRAAGVSFDPIQHAARQNGVHLLRVLYVRLAAAAELSDGAKATRARLLEELRNF